MDRDALFDSADLFEVVTDHIALRSEVQGHRVRVLVGGEVDVATEPALRTFILSAVTSEITEQVIDLSAVTFLDSSGMRGLVLASREAAAAGVAFSLLCPELNTVVTKVLEMLKISSMMTVVTTDACQRG